MAFKWLMIIARVQLFNNATDDLQVSRNRIYFPQRKIGSNVTVYSPITNPADTVTVLLPFNLTGRSSAIIIGYANQT